jgi:hypothetical protein
MWAGFNVPFNVLDHHDGVVDHDANGQHQAEQRRGDRMPEQKQNAKVPTMETGTANSGTGCTPETAKIPPPTSNTARSSVATTFSMEV